MNIKIRFLCLLLLGLVQVLSAQNGGNQRDAHAAFDPEMEAFAESPGSRVLLASSSREYPVTPGDVYQLSYLTTGGAVTFDIIIASDYSVNLNLFGIIDAEGMTYNSLRDRCRSLVLRAYPESRPQLILQSTGSFLIYVKGEVKNASFVTCWGLSRLQEGISGKSTPYTSLRNIDVLSADGKSSSYDLFSFLRYGELTQNPLLKPGDTLILHPCRRRVTLLGEVHRPGAYQLLETDDLEDLISGYGDGWTSLSDPERIRILRYTADDGETGATFYLNGKTAGLAGIPLRDLDEVYIPGKKERLPTVTFEGALDGATGTVVRTYTFAPGEKLSTASRHLAASFSQTSALENAYMLRQGEWQPLAVDIARLLKSRAGAVDPVLEEGDRIIIPFKNYFVFICGAVNSPGRYPFIPDKDYKYYVNLAGGIDPDKNSRGGMRIEDKSGETQPETRILQPEDKIFVTYDNPLYHVERWTPVIELTLSLTALVMGVLQLAAD